MKVRPEALEAAKAHLDDPHFAVRDAIVAFCEVEGLREERMDRVHLSKLIPEVRLVSDWRSDA